MMKRWSGYNANPDFKATSFSLCGEDVTTDGASWVREPGRREGEDVSISSRRDKESAASARVNGIGTILIELEGQGWKGGGDETQSSLE